LPDCIVNSELKDQDAVVIKVLKNEFKTFGAIAAVPCHPPADALVIVKALEKVHKDSAAHIIALIQLKVMLGDSKGAESNLRDMVARDVKVEGLESAGLAERYARLFGVDGVVEWVRGSFPMIEFK
jgi:hypothetical protein